MQKLNLIGNVGNDATVMVLEGGNAVISFSVAHSQSYKDKDGVKVEKVTWWDCSIWRKEGQKAEIAKYLLKGTKVYIEGEPSAETYTTQSGETKISLRCSVSQIELLSAKKED